MSIHKRYATFLALLLPLSFAAPAAVQAQAAPLPSQEISEERITVYANAFRAIGRIMDEMNPLLAAVRNKHPEAQELLREQRRERVLEVYEAHEITEQEFNWIQYVISVNQEQREVFDRVMEELRAGGS